MPFCPSCGKQVDEGVLFCPSCGHNIGATPSASPTPSVPTPPTDRAGRMKMRPLGVTIIVVLDAIAGLFLVLLGGAFFGYHYMMGSFGGPLQSARGLVAGLGLLFVVVGLVTVFLAWGLWRGATWAWTAALVIAILGLILHLLSLNIIGLAINVIIIVYLLQSNVRLYFGH